MFDVSFGELLLILVVGLLVFGPEKLPQVVRTTSQWINHLRRSLNQIRADIEREVGVDELKRDLHNQSILDSLRDVKKDLQGAQDELDRLPYEVNENVRENFRREAQAATPPPAPEHVIPDDDFAHREQPAIAAPAADTTPDNTAAPRPQNP
jgi:sec-independent protein translocase protein TatB